MSSYGRGKLSIDDAIIDYLSKKSTNDQTEKLVLARISSKTETSIQEVEMSINRLASKNLIRKVYVQGKVGFELTPKGKSAIQVLAKAETARITKQLQEAITQQRKTKLILGTIKKMKLIEDKWENFQIPDIKLFYGIEQVVKKFLLETNDIKNKQPLCHRDLKNYEQEFQQYKPQIEKLIEQNTNLNRLINNYSQIKNYLRSISEDIESISKTICKYKSIAEATIHVNQLETSLHKLKSIQSQLKDFNNEQLSEFDELKTKLKDNSRLLENLKNTTHEFTPIKRENFPEKTILYPDPEGPIKYEQRVSDSAPLEKCSKCGITRRLTPVDIG